MAPRIRFLAELIHDVYGFPLEPIEDGALRSSKGLDTLSNGDNEKMAKQTAKQQEVVTAPGRGKKVDMDYTLPSQDWRHIGTRGSVMDSIDFDQEEKEEEEMAELRDEEGEMVEEGTGKGRERGERETSPVSVLDSIDCDQIEKGVEEQAELRVVEGEMAEEGAWKVGEVSGKGTNPITQLNLQKVSSDDMEETGSAESTKTSLKAAAAEKKENGATQKQEEASESEQQDEVAESYVKQDMLNTKPGGEGEGIGREMEESLQTSAEECFGEDVESYEDCGVNPTANIVSRARMRSLASAVEENFKLKVSWQMEGEDQIEDADILLALLNRRSRVQVD